MMPRLIFKKSNDLQCTLVVFRRHAAFLHYFDEFLHESQSAITCSKLTIETLEQGVKYV